MGRERNKGGVGNFFTIPRARRQECRMLARQYAAELLSGQDQPDYATNHGLSDTNGEVTEFMSELQRIAVRLAKSCGREFPTV